MMLPHKLLRLIDAADERHPEDAQGSALKLTVFADRFQQELANGDFVSALNYLARTMYMVVVCSLLLTEDVDAIAGRAVRMLEEEEVKIR